MGDSTVGDSTVGDSKGIQGGIPVISGCWSPVGSKEFFDMCLLPQAHKTVQLTTIYVVYEKNYFHAGSQVYKR